MRASLNCPLGSGALDVTFDEGAPSIFQIGCRDPRGQQLVLRIDDENQLAQLAHSIQAVLDFKKRSEGLPGV